jgi:hypothetical protein
MDEIIAAGNNNKFTFGDFITPSDFLLLFTLFTLIPIDTPEEACALQNSIASAGFKCKSVRSLERNSNILAALFFVLANHRQ